MLIADSQVHIWGADTPERPWPAGRAHQAQKPYPVTKDMVLKEMEDRNQARSGMSAAVRSRNGKASARRRGATRVTRSTPSSR